MKSRGYSVAVCLGIALGAQGCAQLLGYDDDKPTVMEVGGNGGAGGVAGAGGTSCVPVNDMNECTDDVCNLQGMPVHEFKAVGETCTTGGIICDGAGQCVGCVEPATCPGMDDACQTRTCIDAMCGFAYAMMGTACGDVKAVCDGAGACKRVNGTPCVGVAECVTGNCVDGVCCNSACTATCRACNVVGSVGACSNVPFGQDDTNATMTCSGTNQSCDGSGICKKENAQACVGGSDCLSGVCAGSVCSAQSCIGLSANCGLQGVENCCDSPVVTGGTYNRSNNPTYPATVSDFRLDRFEITVGRFRKFVEAYPSSKPASGAGLHPKISGSGWDAAWDVAGSLPGSQADLIGAIKDAGLGTWTDAAGTKENLPMNRLSWYLAFAFCAWDGGRLPTEAEWNYAAAGGNEKRDYPWGGTVPDATLYAVYGCYGDGNPGCALTDILNVGSKSMLGDGKWGQADLAGNVLEWTLDWHESAGYTNISCVDCADISQGTSMVRVARGGGYANALPNLRSDYRGGVVPLTYISPLGARCARSP